ncbi:MAG: hypothetical protein MUC28_03640 [Planctomycetes bacterium]|jgi:hypothetical protein|nr:hypothetical protein [Planctomycetota bacterium]
MEKKSVIMVVILVLALGVFMFNQQVKILNLQAKVENLYQRSVVITTEDRKGLMVFSHNDLDEKLFKVSGINYRSLIEKTQHIPNHFVDQSKGIVLFIK